MEQKRYSINVSIAGVSFSIEFSHIKTALLCRKYMIEEEGSLSVSISDADIEFEKVFSSGIAQGEDYLESQALFRKITKLLIDFDIILMHGAVVSVDNNAYMFTANSGIGKTTHIKKWLENLSNATVVNGDKPYIVLKEDKVYACGSPWCGKEHMHTNIIVPLKSIVFLERSDYNFIKPIDNLQVYPRLLQRTYIPDDIDQANRVVSLLHTLSGKVSFYRFFCNNFRDDCFEVAYSALVNGA